MVCQTQVYFLTGILAVDGNTDSERGLQVEVGIVGKVPVAELHVIVAKQECGADFQIDKEVGCSLRASQYESEIGKHRHHYPGRCGVVIPAFFGYVRAEVIVSECHVHADSGSHKEPVGILEALRCGETHEVGFVVSEAAGEAGVGIPFISH